MSQRVGNDVHLTHPELVEPAEGGSAVRCGVCIRRCVVRPGQSGYCLTRRLEAGGLVSLSYGRVSSLHLAEVERKPLFHFYPGRRLLSVGGVGCNFRCPGCHNWQIAHADASRRHADERYLSPAELVRLARQQAALGLSWTYNEPATWFEYTLAGAELAKQYDLLTNYVTNGSLSRAGLDLIGPYLDSWRVDIKGFSGRTYRRLAGLAKFGAILANTERAKHRWGMHVECVTNVIPTVNDGQRELGGIARWISGHLGPETPWHVTRFVPQFAWRDLPATPVETLERARQIGLDAGLQFVYIGNVPGHAGQNTYCPACGWVIIERDMCGCLQNRVVAGRCPQCGCEIAGRFEPSAGCEEGRTDEPEPGSRG